MNSVLPGLVDTPHGNQYPPEVVQMVLKRFPRGQRAGNHWGGGGGEGRDAMPLVTSGFNA